MGKTAVVYKSKTGFTEKYARWIAGELPADLFEASRVNVEMLQPYDTIIYGGGLYIVGINGVKFITQNLDRFKGKRVIVFATGASPVQEDTIKIIKDKNFTPQEQEQITFFYLRGGFDYQKCKPFDKLLIKILVFVLGRKKELTPDERGMLEVYKNPADFTRKDYTGEIIDYVNS